jgi:hypothetical protein
MNHRFRFLLAAAVLVVFCCFLFQPVFSQERELPLDKILNPLPEFDPFEKPPLPPQFFPDEADKRAREALIDALTNNKESLESSLKFFKAEDERQKKQNGSVTGLTDHVQDLVNNTINDRDKYLAAQKESLKKTDSVERKKYLEATINNDDLTQADQLMRQSSLNTWGGVFNRVLGSVNVVSVASGNLIGAAAETAVNQLYALADRDMPLEQRRALARDLDHLKRYPDDPQNAEIIKRVRKLDGDKKNALVRKQLARANDALKRQELETAEFYAELASFLDSESRDVEKTLQQVRKLLAEREATQKAQLAAGKEPPATTEETQDTGRLLEVLSLRDANQLERIAVDLDTKYRGKPLADAARDAEAVALEIKGWHEEAKKAVQELAKSPVKPETKKHAESLLQSREYNLLASFQDAQTDRQLESVKYVVLGEDLLKKNLIYAAGAMAASGPAGIAALGTVNAMLLGTNLYRVVTNNPISSQPVIDSGVAYIRSHPNSDDAKDVYRVLADLYEEKGLFDRAISYHELAGSPKEKIAAIKEKSAKNLLSAAKDGDRGTREYYLTTIVDRYPESPTAAEATKQLAELAKDESRGLRMSKQFLIENPEIYGPNGLGLKPSLFDGNIDNMEIADRGVNLIADNELLIYFKTPWGVRSQSYPLSKKMTERFFTALRQKNHDVAMASVNERGKDTVGGIKNLPASIVRGDGEKRRERPQDTDETTFSLVREVGGPVPAYPKVLDYELLSDNERDPTTKYKLPPLQGSISASRFSMTGALPTGLWGNQLAIGSDHKAPFAGVQMPIPLLEGFIPIDFMVQGRPGGVAVYPRIHSSDDKNEDAELYR